MHAAALTETSSALRAASVNDAAQPPAFPKPKRASATRQPVALLGIAFDNLTFHETLDRIEKMILSRRAHYVVTANVDFLVKARRDLELQRVLLNAPLVLCDGTPLVWASGLFGNPLPERVAGADLVPALIRVAARTTLSAIFPRSHRGNQHASCRPA